MSLKDAATRAAVLATLYDEIGTQLKAAKAEMQAGLKAAKAETGTRQIGAELPDGTPVAKITLVTPDPAAEVVDDEAFLTWVRQHHPDNVTRRFVTEVRPAFVKSLLAEMTVAGCPQWCDQETGEVHTVPGVKLQPRAAYHRTTFETHGKAAVAAAWQAGQLTNIALPQITPGGAE
ncbi:hypothetical protein [Kitasatospora sp. NPDC050543]|uniref:hypothetical protein n=1 Tax=Kitasatospora sp. NPDC050543 TaxID=3364054 RepID=UPI0037BBE6A0